MIRGISILMITIKELLLQCNVEKLTDVYLGLLSEDTDIEKERVLFNLWIQKIEETQPIENTEKRIIIPSMECGIVDDYTYIDISYVCYNDLKTISEFNEDISHIKDMGNSELRKFLHSIPNIEHFAIDFILSAEILGYMISEASVEKFGKENVMAEIIYEMTFFSYDETEKEKQLEHIEKLATECEKENDASNGSFKTITLDELKNEMGYVDNRTEEERKEEEHKTLTKMCISRLNIIKAINEVKLELGMG